MTIAILLFAWIVIILLFNYIDYRVTKDGGKPDYVKYFIIRAMAAIVHGAVSFILVEDEHYNYSLLTAWQLLLVWAPWLGFQVLSFWLCYELVRNWWTEKPFLYFDTVEHDSGTIDRIFAKLGHTFHAFAKIIALAVAVLCVALLYWRH